MGHPTGSMTMLTNYRVGLHNVGSYQVSGRPFVTGSNSHTIATEKPYEFPMVTSRIQVANYSNGVSVNQEDAQEIRVHFTSIYDGDAVSGSHDYVLSGSVDTLDMKVKCKKIYISVPNLGDARHYRILAELTQIPKERMYELTGSGIDCKAGG
tara:strand:- start:50 stop:508 length:459 start_codon:yes stop_codon:yes gene_type:complete